MKRQIFTFLFDKWWKATLLFILIGLLTVIVANPKSFEITLSKVLEWGGGKLFEKAQSGTVINKASQLPKYKYSDAEILRMGQDAYANHDILRSIRNKYHTLTLTFDSIAYCKNKGLVRKDHLGEVNPLRDYTFYFSDDNKLVWEFSAEKLECLYICPDRREGEPQFSYTRKNQYNLNGYALDQYEGRDRWQGKKFELRFNRYLIQDENEKMFVRKFITNLNLVTETTDDLWRRVEVSTKEELIHAVSHAQVYDSIIVKKGVYTLVDPDDNDDYGFVLQANSVRIIGEPGVFIYAGPNYNVLHISGQNNEIRNLYLAHTASDRCDGSVISIDENAKNVLIQNCDINGCGVIGLDISRSSGIVNLHFKNNLIHNNQESPARTGYGVWEERSNIFDLDNARIEGISFENNKVWNNGTEKFEEPDEFCQILSFNLDDEDYKKLLEISIDKAEKIYHFDSITDKPIHLFHTHHSEYLEAEEHLVAIIDPIDFAGKNKEGVLLYYKPNKIEFYNNIDEAINSISSLEYMPKHNLIEISEDEYKEVLHNSLPEELKNMNSIESHDLYEEDSELQSDLHLESDFENDIYEEQHNARGLFQFSFHNTHAGNLKNLVKTKIKEEYLDFNEEEGYGYGEPEEDTYDDYFDRISHLTITGNIDARDYNFIRQLENLTSLNLKEARIKAFEKFPANEIPGVSFEDAAGFEHLTELILPESLISLDDRALNKSDDSLLDYTMNPGLKGVPKITQERKLDYKVTHEGDGYWTRGIFYESDKENEVLSNVRVKEVNNILYFYFWGIQTDSISSTIRLYEHSSAHDTFVVDSFNADVNSFGLGDVLLSQFDDFVFQADSLYYHKTIPTHIYEFYHLEQASFSHLKYSVGSRKRSVAANYSEFKKSVTRQEILCFNRSVISPKEDMVAFSDGDNLNIKNLNSKNDTVKQLDKYEYSPDDLKCVDDSRGDFSLDAYMDNSEYGDFGYICWDKQGRNLFFDNSGVVLACIWMIDIKTRKVSKIVPEHDAIQPEYFEFEGKPMVAYIENNKLMLCEPPHSF